MTTALPDPPYPATTKLNGYKPEIDWQRIKASKSWRLCPQQHRSSLLRLWLESWNEVPTGSYEDDDELIASSIDMDVEVFMSVRRFLLRGWQKFSDGRLYHPVITEMVNYMISKRITERLRKARNRVPRDNANVPQDAGRNPATAAQECTPNPEKQSASASTNDQNNDPVPDVSRGTTPMSHGTTPMSHGCPTGVPLRKQETGNRKQDKEQEQGVNTLVRANVKSSVATLLDRLNVAAGTNFHVTLNGRLTKAAELAEARLAEYGLHTLIAVVDHKAAQWAGDERMHQYLRPSTLFGKSKCEEYVGQIGIKPNGKEIKPPPGKQQRIENYAANLLSRYGVGNTFEGEVVANEA